MIGIKKIFIATCMVMIFSSLDILSTVIAIPHPQIYEANRIPAFFYSLGLLKGAIMNLIINSIVIFTLLRSMTWLYSKTYDFLGSPKYKFVSELTNLIILTTSLCLLFILVIIHNLIILVRVL